MSSIGSQYPSYSAQSAQDAKVAAAEAKANKPGYDIDDITSAFSSSASGTAAVSLDADLSGTTASTETGTLTLGIAKALQAATSVDPATGRRELISGAGDQLTSTINNLLTSNGFSADEAANATANLSQELAQGGQISLSSTTDRAGQSTSGYTDALSVFSTAETTANASAATHAISIGIDLDTGALNVGLKSQSTTVSQSNALYAGAGYSEEAYSNNYQIASENGAHYGLNITQGAAGSALSEKETDDYSSDIEGTRQVADTLDGSQSVINVSFSLVNGQYSSKQSSIAYDKSQFASASGLQLEQAIPAPTGVDGADQPGTIDAAQPEHDATTNDPLQRLIANLTDPKIFREAQASSLVQQLSSIADGVRAQVKATADALDKEIAARKAQDQGGTQTTAEAQQTKDLEAHAQDATDLYKGLSASDDGSSVSTQVGVHQTVSISQTDQDGNRTTLYRRPDGSLGKFTETPTNLTA